jgi:FkbM family methyltransferase
MSTLQTAARHAAGFLGRESRLIRRLRPLYESLLDWSGGGQGIPWTINGETYRVDPHQRHRLGAHYDATVAAFLRDRVKPGALCLDVGANVGVYVLQFARWAGPTGRVIAFEPNPGALSVLREHVRMNKLDEQVRIVPSAVGAAAGSAILYAAGADGMSRLGAPNREIAEHVSPITVPLLALDDYCATENLEPDWLFIDIEGFELAALYGARELMKSRKGELGIIVEMHPSVWDSAGTTREKVLALLDDLQLQVQPLTGQADALGEHGLVYLDQK